MSIFRRDKSKKTTDVAIQAVEEVKRVIEEQPSSEIKDMDDSSYQKIIDVFSTEIKNLSKEDFYQLIDRLKQQYDENLVTNLVVDSAREGNIDDERVSEIATNLSDKNAVQVIKEVEIPVAEQTRIIDSIEDEKIKQLGLLKTLQNIYENCDTKDEWELGTDIKNLGIDSQNSEMVELIHKIVAKKIAIGYQETGGPKRVSTFIGVTGIMTAEEMLQCNLPKMVEQEYEQLMKKAAKRKLENKRNKPKVFPYQPSELIVKILDELAINQVQQYQKVGMFLIPQSDVMMNLDPEQEEAFIRAIDNNLKVQTDGEEELSILQIKSIKDQMRGEINNVGLKELINSFNHMPPEEINDAAYLCQTIVSNPKIYQVYKNIAESSILSSLLHVPEESRKAMLKSFGGVVNQYTKKGYFLAAQSPRLKRTAKKEEKPTPNLAESKFEDKEIVE